MGIDFKLLPHEGIRSLVPYKPGKAIEELAREKNLTDIIKLASNENPLGCSPMALEALRAMSPHLIATYPAPINHVLVDKLAGKLNVNPKQVFLSNGSDYIYSMLLNCFALHTNKHILVHDYTFSTYAIQANTFNIPVKSVPINDRWEVNIDTLIEACTEDTGILFFANPNNPTGVLTSQSELKRLLANIPASTILVLDEAYYEYAAAHIEDNSINWLDQYPNLVITRTFSKIYGLAGLRLGYAIANPDIIALLQRVQLPFSVNQAVLNAASAAVDDADFIKRSLANNQQGMQQMCSGLDALGVQYIPSSCNFITFDCKDDALLLYNYLLDRGIIVRPLHPYNMPNYMRVTIGTEPQNARFLAAIRNYYDK